MAVQFVSRVARHARPLFIAVTLIAALVGTLTTAALGAPLRSPLAAPAAKPKHKPTIDEVQKQLGQLAVRNSQIVDEFDSARVRVTKLAGSARRAAAAAKAARARYNRANVAFTQVVQAQYESGGVSVGGALLDSSSNTGYLDSLSTMNLLSNHDAAVVSTVRSTHRAAQSAATKADSLLARATARRDALGKRKTKVSAQIAKYRRLLATLNSQQREDYLRAQNPNVTHGKVSNIQVHATSAAARKAIQFALAQVGKPYVWGAAGPGSYDCSGLTMASWAHAGVSLPHSAAQQYHYGHHVSRNDLQPGDLIFFYQPIGHVTIYIGNGLMVSAPTAGENVSVVPLDAFNSDYTGATRLT